MGDGVDEEVAQHADRSGSSTYLLDRPEADNLGAVFGDDHAAVLHQVPDVCRVSSAPLVVLTGSRRYGRDDHQVGFAGISDQHIGHGVLLRCRQVAQT
jgi:hypothetical protein